MNEYLEKQTDGTYKLVMRGESCKADDIEVPVGADVLKYFYGDSGLCFYRNGFSEIWQDKINPPRWDKIHDVFADGIINGGELLWQRSETESLNDQYSEIEQVRQAINKSWGSVGASSGGAKKRDNDHYYIDVSDLDEIDFYEIAKRYNVTDPAIQHILKKCLAVGNRGHKDMQTDLKDIFKTAKRAIEINGVEF